LRDTRRVIELDAQSFDDDGAPSQFITAG